MKLIDVIWLIAASANFGVSFVNFYIWWILIPSTDTLTGLALMQTFDRTIIAALLLSTGVAALLFLKHKPEANKV